MSASIRKIGIITFHRSYNYGSALQAYALKEYLIKLGYIVKLIDYIDTDDFEQYRLFRARTYRKSPKSFVSDLVFFPAHLKRKMNFNKFANKYLNLTDKQYNNLSHLAELNNQFDAFICGSDQIWNLDCTNGINPAFFLRFVKDEKRKIAYAPSLAHTKFRKDYSQELIPYLKRLDCISVRERESVSYIEHLVGDEVKQVVDPTLLLESKDYEKLTKNVGCKRKYVFMYMLENNDEMVKFCLEFAQRNNLKIYYLTTRCFPRIRGKNLYGVTPNEFLSYIKKASYIITNSFHATVFSIVFKKKFLTFGTKNSSSRIQNLLHILDIEERMDHNCIDNDIDYDAVYSELQKFKKYSIQYLCDSLK